MKSDTLSPVLYHLECTPLISGFSPSSWQHATDVMIEKQPGNFLTTKLRAIILYDCVANHAFKQVGRAMMNHAENLNAVAVEQGGSRRHHRAIYLALQKRITFDLSRQYKRPLALCSNDAKSCYDRIVHSVAATSMS